MIGLVGGDGLVPGSTDKFITEDLQSGRMVDVIESGEPAIMVCYWPGIYFNGNRVGFNILKQINKRLEQKYDYLIWMKLSEIPRYWAAKELTSIPLNQNKLTFKAPFSTPGFTLNLNSVIRNPGIKNGGEEIKPLVRVNDKKAIKAQT